MAKHKSVILTEQYGVSSVKNAYRQSSEGQLEVENCSTSHSSVAQFFRSVFLPQGYPDSVSADYAEYQVWDTVQAFASSISGSLATHSLLQGMGVGDDSASVLAATFTWIIKDGTGMTGRILFAWLKGDQLDCNAKRWRLFADFLNDFALCIEILAPLATEKYFRTVVCFAGVCKSLVGVAGGATRAALTQHQARRNNMADVSAKDGSQETLVNLAALVCSLGMLPLVSGHMTLTAFIFLAMTILHLFANYRAVRAVCMESLNQPRLRLILQDFFISGEVASVAAINAAEPILWTPHWHWRVKLGASFSSIRKNVSILKKVFGNKDVKSSLYLLDFDKESKTVNVVLSPQAEMSDQLQACVQAELIAFFISGLTGGPESLPVSDSYKEDLLLKTYMNTQDFYFPRLLKELDAKGWRHDNCLLAADEWRATWDFEGMADKKIE